VEGWRLLPLCLAALLVAGGAGCGTSPGDRGPGPASFAGAPQQSVETTSRAVRVDVRWWPQPPAVGSAAAELTMIDSSTGLPIPGLAVTVVPWMPAHGHGSPVQPGVLEKDTGVFVADPIYLFMPGSWQLRTTIGGAVDDTATISFEIP
jgi:hypothetical protein